MELNKDTFEKLKSMYSDNGIERGGYILRSGEVVEIENCADEKSDNFTFSCYDLDKMEFKNIKSCQDYIERIKEHNSKYESNKEVYDRFIKELENVEF